MAVDFAFDDKEQVRTAIDIVAKAAIMWHSVPGMTIVDPVFKLIPNVRVGSAGSVMLAETCLAL